MCRLYNVMKCKSQNLIFQTANFGFDLSNNNWVLLSASKTVTKSKIYLY